MTLVDLFTERRLLAGMILEPHVLSAADDVEAGDFSDMRCHTVLAAVRQLRSDGADFGIDEIDHEIKLQDLSRDRMGRGALAATCGFWFVAELLLEHAPYAGMPLQLEHDMGWLRELAERRRALQAAA